MDLDRFRAVNDKRLFLALAASALVIGCSSDGGSGFGPSIKGKSASGDSGVAPELISAKSDAGTASECAGVIIEAERSPVDIIFVVDQSGSMGEEIAQVKANINSFAQSIGGSGLDYRVVMIAEKATSASDNDRFAICVPPPLGGPNCASNPPRFLVVDRNVQSTDALALTLSTYSRWRGSLRPESTKVFIPITDDDSRDKSATAFDSELLALDGAMFGDTTRRKYVLHGIVGVSASVQNATGTTVSQARCSTAVNSGAEYQRLSILTGGMLEPLCNPSFEQVFANIASGIKSTLACNIAMPKSSGQAVDADKVIVEFSQQGGSAAALTQVTDASKCGAVSDGWYYDDASKPTRILLCPSACTNVSGGGKLQVKVGCAAPAPR